VAQRAFHIALTSLAVAMACASALGGAPAAHGKAPSPAPLVVIDPGHGGRYSNANANRLREKNVNLAIAKELRTALIARGYRVKMTRTTDRAVVYGDIRTWNYSASKNRWAYSEDGRRGLVGGIPKDDLQGRVNVANAAGAPISTYAGGRTCPGYWSRLPSSRARRTPDCSKRRGSDDDSRAASPTAWTHG